MTDRTTPQGSPYPLKDDFLDALRRTIGHGTEHTPRNLPAVPCVGYPGATVAPWDVVKDRVCGAQLVCAANFLGDADRRDDDRDRRPSRRADYPGMLATFTAPNTTAHGPATWTVRAFIDGRRLLDLSRLAELIRATVAENPEDFSDHENEDDDGAPVYDAAAIVDELLNDDGERYGAEGAAALRESIRDVLHSDPLALYLDDDGRRAVAESCRPRVFADHGLKGSPAACGAPYTSEAEERTAPADVVRIVDRFESRGYSLTGLEPFTVEAEGRHDRDHDGHNLTLDVKCSLGDPETGRVTPAQFGELEREALSMALDGLPDAQRADAEAFPLVGFPSLRDAWDEVWDGYGTRSLGADFEDWPEFTRDGLDKAADRADEYVRERGWEDATDCAAELFGKSAEVWSSGRCGGHLVLSPGGRRGYPSAPENLDADDVERWHTFTERARQWRSGYTYELVREFARAWGEWYLEALERRDDVERDAFATYADGCAVAGTVPDTFETFRRAHRETCAMLDADEADDDEADDDGAEE